jgi:beta-glucosidase
LPSARPEVARANLGSPEHQAIGREAVRKSLVLLKNNNALLPFNPSGHIAVIGEAANSMSQQTGGWTLSWQGDANANAEFETGQTIYAGLKEKITAAGGKISYAKSAAALRGNPDLVIYVFGEKPYAEFKGDMSDLVFEFADGQALADLTALKKRNLPIVSLFLTGRPLWVNPHINRSDAFVVGWLPGTQGGGIADVLAADKNGIPQHDFTGRLSFSWPSDGRGAPIDARSKSGVQFPFGYGLDYQTASASPMAAPVAVLSEAAGVAAPNGAFDGVMMARGAVQAPFSLFLGDSSNWKTPAKSFLATSLGGTLSSRGIDHRAQEDARQLSWRGNGRGLLSVQSQRAADFTALGKISDLAVSLHYRLDKKPDAPVFWAMGCGDNCGAKLDITETLAQSPLGAWQKLTVPLRCFAESGLNARAVNAPLLLETNGTMVMSLTGMDIIKGTNECP